MKPQGILESIALTGVEDKPSWQIPTATDDAKRTGLQAMVGPFRVEVFERVLNISGAGGTVPDNRTAGIDPRFVLATAWNADRLKNALNLYKSGREAPAIEVVGVRFPGLPVFYHVVDGMHRTVVARMDGRSWIKANIDGYWTCDPSALDISEWDENPEVCAAADAMGIRVRRSALGRLYRRINGD